MDIRQLSTTVVYENPWMRVREDQVERSDGSKGIFGVVEKADFALIVPVDASGNFWMVEQYRYPVEGRYLEFPQGSWEDAPDVDTVELARGELREETGLEAGHMHHLGHLFEAYGYCDQGFDVWLATDLTVVGANRGTEEQDMVARRVMRSDVRNLVTSGRLKDAPSLAALSLLLMYEDL